MLFFCNKTRGRARLKKYTWAQSTDMRFFGSFSGNFFQHRVITVIPLGL